MCVTLIFIQHYKLSRDYVTANSEFGKQAQQEVLKLKLTIMLHEVKEKNCSFTYKN